MKPASLDTKKKLKRDERRVDIVRGAAEAFVKNGYEATNLDDVAKSAGVSRALLYRHFDTKQAIYQAVIDNFLVTFHANVARPPRVKLGGDTLAGLVTVAQIDPNGFRLFFRHTVREPGFREYYDSITSKRLSHIEDSLKTYISDAEQRLFKAELIQELIFSTILIWIDKKMPNPEQMPKLLSGILNVVIESEDK
jgi:AcrR family transcriptional regulator